MNKTDNIRKNTTNYPWIAMRDSVCDALLIIKVSVLKPAVNPQRSAKSK